MSKMSNWKLITINPNYSISCIGQVKNNKTNKLLIPKLTKGHYVVKLKLNTETTENTENTENTEYKMYKVDKLVAKAFIENPNNLHYIKHKNGLLNDNRVSNIEWIANKPLINLNNINNININSYPKIKHYVKYMICKNESKESKKKLYFKTEKEALEKIKTIQLTNPEYKSKIKKKIYYLTEITYNEKKFYKKHQDYLLVHRLHRQMYLVIKYCNLFLKLLNKNKKNK